MPYWISYKAYKISYRVYMISRLDVRLGNKTRYCIRSVTNYINYFM